MHLQSNVKRRSQRNFYSIPVFPFSNKIGSADIFILLKFKNRLDTEINYFNFEFISIRSCTKVQCFHLSFCGKTRFDRP